MGKHVRIDKMEKHTFDFKQIETKFNNLEDGGQYNPTECKARHKVAIIVPYRNRKYQLKVFLHHIHSFLQRQQLFYRIFVIEIVSVLHALH